MIILRINKGVILSLLVCSMVYGFNNTSQYGGSAMSIIKKGSLLHESSLAIDMYEKNGNIIAKMDIPGIDPNDIEVEIEDGQLHIFGERKAKEEIKEENYYYKETEYGRFDRLVSLPSDIDKAGMSYEIIDGVLTVTIPKK